MEAKEVAEAVLFMLTRPRNVTIRDLVILPFSSGLMKMAAHFIGIDVGTGSARAGVFDENGELLAAAKRAIDIFQEAGDIVEQSSEDIWRAVSASVREAVAAAGVDTADIRGSGIRRHMFAGGCRSRWRPGCGRKFRRSGAQHHRLDGPSRRWRSRARSTPAGTKS